MFIFLFLYLIFLRGLVYLLKLTNSFLVFLYWLTTKFIFSFHRDNSMLILDLLPFGGLLQ